MDNMAVITSKMDLRRLFQVTTRLRANLEDKPALSMAEQLTALAFALNGETP